MVDYNLIQSIGIPDDEADTLIREALGEDVATGNMDGLLREDLQEFKVGKRFKVEITVKSGTGRLLEILNK